MKKLLFLLIFILPILAQAQPEIGSIKYLDFKKSYKSVRLGSDISTLNSSYLLRISEKPDASGCYIYTYSDPAALNFGSGIALKRIQLRIYHDKIASVYLFFDQSDGNKIKEIFTTAYGKVYSQKDELMDQYVWLGTLADVYLTYEDSNLSAAIYSDLILNKIIHSKAESSTSQAASDL